eukprot:TRINITY_DN878_c0_g1_i1.p1 TRINITY_DN878_c0_g1~~TRINITY_DN878_c0_g1_i1.p1  ORF type:complete len:659 (-),score=77.98 TRINITY_DN878_c0_g1_i1:125-2002(-)
MTPMEEITTKKTKKKNQQDKKETQKRQEADGIDQHQITQTQQDYQNGVLAQSQKKEKKRKLRATQPESQVENGVSSKKKISQEKKLDITSTQLDSDIITEKKKKKKKNNKDDNRQEELMDTDDPEQQIKKKKKKKIQKDSTSQPQQLAQVGDESLATNGKAIIKNVYHEHQQVTAMSDQQVEELREERKISVECSGTDNFKIMTSFEHLNLPKNMIYSIRDFVCPSPIQSQCWPIILQGYDMIGVAATGSGKTLGFGIPALQHIESQRQHGVVQGTGPFVLIMAPTRELAVQISEVLQEAGSQCNCRCVCVYGGVPKYTQKEVIAKGVEIVVGTPGRVEDLVQEGSCSLKQVTYVVLDEADRMLDLGFEPAMRSIIGRTRADRQTLMFSATWPESVRKLASEFLCDPVKVQVGSKEISAAKSVKQTVEVIEDHQKMTRLVNILSQQRKNGKEGKKMKIIIFVLYKKEAPQLENTLNKRGFSAVAVHGDASQSQRQQAVNQFKDNNIPILVATDVAARGLDIPDVQMVINYTFPLTIEDYVHRIGRTGRAGKAGISHTFFCPRADKGKAGELVNVLREAGQKVPEELLKFGTAVKKKESKVYGAHFKEVDMNEKATRTTFDDSDED